MATQDPHVFLRERYPEGKNGVRKEAVPKKKAPQMRVVAQAKRREPTLMKKVKDSAIGEGAETLWDMIIQDVVMPAIRGLLDDTANQVLSTIGKGISTAIHGDSAVVKARYGARGAHTNYGGFSNVVRSRLGDHPREDRSMSDYGSRAARTSHDFSDIVFDTRAECEEVLYDLSEMMNTYGEVTKASFLQAAGITSDFTDENWGWKDIRGARIKSIGRDGFIIDMPRMVAL